MKRKDVLERYCWFCWVGARCFRLAARGTFASAASWSGVIGVGVLGAVLNFYGRAVMPPERAAEIVAQALLYIALAWCVIFAVRLLFISPFLVFKDGKWYGNEFVYNEPRLAFSRYVSPTTNNQVLPFRFHDAPPFAYVNYKFELDGPSDFISVVVMRHPSQVPDFDSERELQYTKGGIKVARKRDAYLKTFLKRNASPFSVRIMVTSWVVGDCNQNEYRRAEFEPARWG